MTPPIPLIKRVVSDAYLLRDGDLEGRRRNSVVTRARHIAMWLVFTLTEANHAQIGRQFGRRDEATVRFAVSKITAQRADDEGMAEETAHFASIIRYQMKPSQPDAAGVLDLAHDIAIRLISLSTGSMALQSPLRLMVALLPVAEILGTQLPLTEEDPS